MTSKIPVPTETVLVDTVEKCAAMCTSIFEAKSTTDPKVSSDLAKRGVYAVAVDLEGVNLGRTGSICIVTIATLECVYLVDICALQKTAFEKGGLKNLFESTDVVKLMFDCRSDADALYHLYGVTPKNVCDLQVMTTARFTPSGRYLMGMKKAFGRLDLITSEEGQLKEKGCILFAPEKGGSYEVWEKRPLDPLLIDYCAVDVKYFFTVHEMLCQHHKKALLVGEQRVRNIIVAERPKREDQVLRDF